MNKISYKTAKFLTRTIRRFLVGKDQQWIFQPPSPDWILPKLKSTSLYLHVPFCIYFCPYCPYTKVRYHQSLVEPFTKAAIAEVDWWANRIGAANLGSIYIGGGTPTLAMGSVKKILEHIQKRFNLVGKICIETNPASVNPEVVKQLHNANISLVSLGIQSFNQKNLHLLGRRYTPLRAEQALTLLVEGGFSSINTDLMFSLPGQTVEDVLEDLDHAAKLGANQLTTYPLFTFPYSSVGKYLQLSNVEMPNLKVRRSQYHAIHNWCKENNFKRISVWGFKQGDVPRYSSVTRAGYIGIGPGAGSQLPSGFALNTFNLDEWISSLSKNNAAIALFMPFTAQMSAWWWLYWRLYDTRFPISDFEMVFGNFAAKARFLLKILEKMRFTKKHNGNIELTEAGAFWVHLAQNHFVLDYINTVWTNARLETWPQEIAI